MGGPLWGRTSLGYIEFEKLKKNVNKYCFITKNIFQEKYYFLKILIFRKFQDFILKISKSHNEKIMKIIENVNFFQQIFFLKNIFCHEKTFFSQTFFVFRILYTLGLFYPKGYLPTPKLAKLYPIP